MWFKVSWLSCTCTGLSLRAVSHNTCYGWVCLIFPWCYSWNSLLFREFTHKVTNLLWVWRIRLQVTKKLMTTLHVHQDMCLSCVFVFMEKLNFDHCMSCLFQMVSQIHLLGLHPSFQCSGLTTVAGTHWWWPQIKVAYRAEVKDNNPWHLLHLTMFEMLDRPLMLQLNLPVVGIFTHQATSVMCYRCDVIQNVMTVIAFPSLRDLFYFYTSLLNFSLPIIFFWECHWVKLVHSVP